MSVTRLEVLEAMPAGVALAPLEVARRIWLQGRPVARDAFSLSGAQRYQVDFPDEVDADGDAGEATEDGEQLALALGVADDDEDDEAQAHLAQVERHINWLLRQAFVRRVSSTTYVRVEERVRERTCRGRIYLTGEMPQRRRALTVAAPAPVSPVPPGRPQPAPRRSEPTWFQHLYTTGESPKWGPMGPPQRSARRAEDNA